MAGLVEVKLSGTLRVDRRFTTRPEDQWRRIGRRPFMVAVVYATGVLTDTDVTEANTPSGGSFLVSQAFNPPPADVLDENGASAGAIGTYQSPGGGDPDYFVFRRPEPNEVVWAVSVDDQGTITDRGLYRFRDGQWGEYLSLPERALRTPAFDLFDPDQVWLYWARLLGSSHFEMTRDAREVQDLLESARVPERFVTRYAGNLGLTLRKRDDVVTNRKRLRDAVPSHKAKGLDALVRTRLRALGFDGYAMEVWVNPEHADNWTVPAGAPAAVQADLEDRGLTEEVAGTLGEKGQDWEAKPHGWSADEAVTYFPSSAVGLHLRRLDGLPVNLKVNAISLRLLKEDIARELRRGVLPACVWIRYFASDVNVGKDQVGVSDTLTVTKTPGVTEWFEGGLTPTAVLGGDLI